MAFFFSTVGVGWEMGRDDDGRRVEEAREMVCRASERGMDGMEWRMGA